jgi:predicted RNA binding protein YcfA (HicA-like mRNA interferase family)
LLRKELIRKFKVFGYDGPFAGKRHQFMRFGHRKIRIPNPHGNQEISAGLVSEIVRQAGIDPVDWDRA